MKKSRIAILFDFLEALLGGGCSNDELGLSVLEVHGRRQRMIERAPLQLFDTEKHLIGVTREDAKGPFTWESSDPSQVGVEPQGDGRTCYVTTPLDSGEATITVKAKGYPDESMKVSYSDSTPGELGLAPIGGPEPD